jgi:hypothetical protein
MERHMIVFAAIVTNDLKAFLRIVVVTGRFFRPAFSTTLRRHHIALIEHLLFLFREQKDLLALHTRDFYVRHC